MKLYTCPCCGYLSIPESPGSYEICHVCFWEDDAVQLLDPWYWGGANQHSLAESQQNFIAYGACDLNGKEHASGMQPGDERDPQWRPIVEADRAKACALNKVPEEQLHNLNFIYYWLRP